MGLDISIFRISKPNYAPEKVYERCDIEGIILNENDLAKPMYQQLSPYCQKLRVHNQYYDMKKIREDYGLPEYASIVDMSSAGIIVYDKKMIEISAKLIDKKYTLAKVEDHFVCLSEEVRYWRKAYDIQNWFHENISDQVKNTGYYVLGEELLEEFNEAWPDDAVELEIPSEESALFYCEWY